MKLESTITEVQLGELSGSPAIIAIKGECRAKDIREIKAGIWQELGIEEITL